MKYQFANTTGTPPVSKPMRSAIGTPPVSKPMRSAIEVEYADGTTARGYFLNPDFWSHTARNPVVSWEFCAEPYNESWQSRIDRGEEVNGQLPDMAPAAGTIPPKMRYRFKNTDIPPLQSDALIRVQYRHGASVGGIADEFLFDLDGKEDDVVCWEYHDDVLNDLHQRHLDTQIMTPTSEPAAPSYITELVKKAMDTITQRGVDYDSPTTGERSGPAIAAAFNAITGKDLTAAEVYLLLRLSKDVRQWQVPTRYHADSAVDRVSYDLLIGEALLDQFRPKPMFNCEDGSGDE